MANYQQLCQQILSNIGEKQNISFVTHCITRLRINVKDQSQVNIEEIKKIEGILGCQFSGGQFQVIIGQHVDKVYQIFNQLIDESPENKSDDNIKLRKNRISLKSIANTLIDVISGCVTPILPIITATGIIKLISALLGKNMLNLLPEDADFMVLMTFVGNAGFYFFPMFVAWAAAKKFNTNIPIALFLGAVLIHPTLIALVQKGTEFSVYGIPMQLVDYSSQFLPSIIIVWVMSYVYQLFDKYSPKSLKIILVPTGTMLVMLPIALSLVGPLGNLLGQALASIFSFVHQLIGPIAVGLIGSLWYFLVATGMHQALIALAITEIGLSGADSIILVGAESATYALMGLTIAFLIRCKKEEKAIASSNIITLLVGGISEPTIFTMLLRYKKAIIIQLVAGMCGGILASMFAAKVHFFGATNILTGLAFGPDLLLGMLACSVAFIVALILGIMIGFDDSQFTFKRGKKNK